MDHQGIETSADEFTLSLVDERIKQTSGPILRLVEELCALLAGRTNLESAGNSEASGLERGNMCTIPSRTRHDRWFGFMIASGFVLMVASLIFKNCDR